MEFRSEEGCIKNALWIHLVMQTNKDCHSQYTKHYTDVIKMNKYSHFTGGNYNHVGGDRCI